MNHAGMKTRTIENLPSFEVVATVATTSKIAGMITRTLENIP
jgi:hypothetical protein